MTEKIVNINLNDHKPEECAACGSISWLPTFNIRRIPGMLVAANTPFVNHEMPAPICAMCSMTLKDSLAQKEAENSMPDLKSV